MIFEKALRQAQEPHPSTGSGTAPFDRLRNRTLRQAQEPHPSAGSLSLSKGNLTNIRLMLYLLINKVTLQKTGQTVF